MRARMTIFRSRSAPTNCSPVCARCCGARPNRTVEHEPVVCGRLRVDLATRTAWDNGEPLALTAVELDILELLMRSAGRVVSRDELAASVLQRELTPFDRALDVHISRLRKKLEGAATIQT